MTLEEKTLKTLPPHPGVYLFKDAGKNVLYVGKSRSLSGRVKSYFQKNNLSPAKQLMVPKIASIDTTITDSEGEALLLEATLIKKYRPPFNVILRDDKSYSYICIDYTKKYPEIYRIRQNKVGVGRDRLREKQWCLFGPFTSGSTAINALWIVKKYFPICLSPNKKLKRGCFNYTIHKCPGACLGTADPTQYRKVFVEIEQFLSGNTKKLEVQLEHEIKNFALKEQYEQADIRKKLLFSIQNLHEHQKVTGRARENADYVSFVSFGNTGCFNILTIRHGSLYDQKNFLVDQIQSPPETIIQTLDHYLSSTSDLPKMIYTSRELGCDHIEGESFLLQTSFSIPQKTVLKGERLQLLHMGEKNAQEFLFQHTASLESHTPIEKLCQFLRIPYARGFRTEIYDVSHIQGSEPVGSMVVFRDSDPDKSQYRKFKLAPLGKPNDFAHMEEVLTRRFRHSSQNYPSSEVEKYHNENPKSETRNPKQILSQRLIRLRQKNSKSKIQNALRVTRYALRDSWPLPNLLMIDGGKGQLSIAKKVLRKYQLSIPLLSLAKREEKIFIPGRKDPLRLSRANAALKLLQHMRNEAHRFGITFYQQRHSRALFKQ